MIKIENVEVVGWNAALRGMRNAMDSWDRADSYPAVDCEKCGRIDREGFCKPGEHRQDCAKHLCFEIGPNDHDLAMRLAKGGPVHAKYRRMIVVYLDVVAPLYWWKEFETYRNGVVPNPIDIEMNSCSTMHKIHAKKFTLDDFSHEHLEEEESGWIEDEEGHLWLCGPTSLETTIGTLNAYRYQYLKSKDKKYWWPMIQLLPSPYNQRRTLMLNYEVLTDIYRWRKDHKLDEWREFCKWIESLPYSEFITLEEDTPKEEVAFDAAPRIDSIKKLADEAREYVKNDVKLTKEAMDDYIRRVAEAILHNPEIPVCKELKEKLGDNLSKE